MDIKVLTKMYLSKLVVCPIPTMMGIAYYSVMRSMDRYSSALKPLIQYQTSLKMNCEINNKRRYKGLKPLRKHTWKRLKGS